MSDAEDVRRIAMSLDGVVEIESDGFDFRVSGHGFVWSYPERTTGRRVIRTDIAVLYVGDESEKQALLLGEPDLFFTAPGTRTCPWFWSGSRRLIGVGCGSSSPMPGACALCRGAHPRGSRLKSAARITM